MSVSKEKPEYKLRTDELEDILGKTHPSDLDRFISENESELLGEDREFTRYLNIKLKEKKILKKDMYLRADISENYGSKLVTMEKKTAQRDVILRLLYAARFSLDEVQHALRLYQMPLLYARDPRDALLMSCISNPPGDIIELNELLVKNNLQPLRSSGVQE